MLEDKDPTFRESYEQKGMLRLLQYQYIGWLAQWPALGGTIGFEALAHVIDYEPLFEM